MRDPLDLMETFSDTASDIHLLLDVLKLNCTKTVQAYLGHASLQMTMDLYTAVMEHKK